MAKGINVRCSQGELVFDAFLQDPAGNLVTSGSTYFRLYRVIGASGTIESFDWNDANFKQSTLTTENLSASHRKGNNGVRDTGLWTTRLSSLGNFSLGDICYLQVDNTYASPKIQTQKFQFGSAEGDMTVNTSGFLNVNVNSWRDSIPEILQTGMVHAWSTNTGASSSGSSSDVNVVSWGGVSVPAIVSGMLPVLVNDYNVDRWPLQPATARRTLNVTSLGRAGINWGDIENQSSSANLSNTFIYGLFQNLSNVNITGWLGLPPNPLIAGRTDSYVGAMASNVLDSNALATSAVTEIQTGLATTSDINSVSGKFNNLSVNVSGWRGLQPAVLNSSRVDVYVGDMAADTINSTTLATSAVTEINSLMPTLSDLLSISGLIQSPTGILNVNVIQWSGQSVSPLISGNAPSIVKGYLVGEIPLRGIVENRKVDVTSSGTIGINWGNIENKTSRVLLTNTSVSGVDNSVSGTVNANVIQWLGSGVNSLVSGYMPSIVQMYASGQVPLKPTVENRTLDVTSNGNAGIDWSNIENPTSPVNLVNTSVSGVNYFSLGNVSVNVSGWRGLSPNVLQNGRVDAYVGAMGTDVLNAAALASDAVTEIQNGLSTTSQILSISGYLPRLDVNVSTRLAPSVTGRTLDVTISGTTGINWGNIENPTTRNLLTNTSISGIDNFVSGIFEANVVKWRGDVPDVLATGMVHSYINGLTGSSDVNVITWAGVSVSPLISGLLPVLVNDYNVGKWPLQPIVDNRKIDVSTSGYVGIFANLDKQNYILGPSGLDYISVIHATGTASNYREMGIQTWRRFFKKTTLNAASGIITFDDNDTTIITRQAVSDNGTTQTQFSS